MLQTALWNGYIYFRRLFGHHNLFLKWEEALGMVVISPKASWIRCNVMAPQVVWLGPSSWRLHPQGQHVQLAMPCSAHQSVTKLLVQFNAWFPTQHLSWLYYYELVIYCLYFHQHFFVASSLDELFEVMGTKIAVMSCCKLLIQIKTLNFHKIWTKTSQS